MGIIIENILSHEEKPLNVAHMYFLAFSWVALVVKKRPADAVDNKRGGFNPWIGKRKARQPTPVFLPGESHARGVLRATIHKIANSWTLLKQLSMMNLCTYSIFRKCNKICFTWSAIYKEIVLEVPSEM